MSFLSGLHGQSYKQTIEIDVDNSGSLTSYLNGVGVFHIISYEFNSSLGEYEISQKRKYTGDIKKNAGVESHVVKPILISNGWSITTFYFSSDGNYRDVRFDPDANHFLNDRRIVDEYIREPFEWFKNETWLGYGLFNPFTQGAMLSLAVSQPKIAAATMLYALNHSVPALSYAISGAIKAAPYMSNAAGFVAGYTVWPAYNVLGEGVQQLGQWADAYLNSVPSSLGNTAAILPSVAPLLGSGVITGK